MQHVRQRLGQLLVEANILTPDQLETVLALQRIDGRRLGQLLVVSGLCSETRITQVLSQQLSVPWVSLYHIDFSRELLGLVRRELADQYGLIPIYVRAVRGQGDTLYVAMEDPMNEDALRECTACAGLPTRAMIAAPSEIRRAIRIYYGASSSSPSAGAPAPAEARERPTGPAGAAEGDAPHLVEVTPANVHTLAAAPVPAVPAAVAVPAEVTSEPDVLVVDDGPVLEVHEIELPKTSRKRKQVELTLLDGTRIQVPSPSRARAADLSRGEPSSADIVAALRAVARGDDPGDVLGENLRWERMMAAVLDLLLRKHLILERELIEALKKV